ncbi:sensor domain-containing diguanylate cyclase [Ruminococcus sp. OA3]|uniref:sensor domain-containing diguanylate cyclase n=1 Tax=Ruminococcus sp. OA3 TaxID=2914164 RepID=UPI001F068D31|nr:sensor domain-containing diguanylate cyclase [Ruminococcus sp. OA3]MCH1983527.1 sensor domain-containing diguanylate cyclase [Ruminococcus sp. OA3]
MKKNVLLRTNLLVCVIIIIGFFITAVISYQTNWDVYEKDIEQVSNLTMESISHQIDSNFTKPVNISLTMANDSLLKNFLNDENEHLEDQDFIHTMREYLETYRVKYDYDSVFLVSTQTQRYYHFNGLDRTLTPDNPENDWYYTFLETKDDYSLNIDNDEAAQNEITVFINAKIYDQAGETMGIVGVGFRVDTLQQLLLEYENEFEVRAYLVDPKGTIEISTDRTGYEDSDLFTALRYSKLEENILGNTEDRQEFWYGSQNIKGYLVSQFIPNLGWFLLVDHDTSALSRQLMIQLIRAVVVIFAVIVSVLLTITGIIRKYNRQVIKLTVAREQEHQAAFMKATEQMYENIYELDITHNRAASEATEQYFESLGAPRGTPYDEALKIIAQKQIKEEYRLGYITTFSSGHVLEAYQRGTENLCYDFMISTDGEEYYWMRINAHIFTWQEDNSVRMLTYRQNIDAEKRREHVMFDKMQRDSLTWLYNKAATQEHIRSLLEESCEQFAFFILDVDEFKLVNDRFGHAAGDKVLIDFAQTVKSQFGDGDVVGRIGGDEFVAFSQIRDHEAAEKKAGALTEVLRREVDTDSGICRITSSIGVAVTSDGGSDFETLYRNADMALYQAKNRGKNGFVIYGTEKNTDDSGS